MTEEQAHNSSAPAAEGSNPLGIDLGTTMSATAVVDGDGNVVTLRNEEEGQLTPSALYFSHQEVHVGSPALQREQDPNGYFIDLFKRDMGEPHYHERVRDYWVPPEVFAALVLKKLAADAARQVGTIGKVVITVPAHFDERRRQATIDAGRLAGLDVGDIINEPTAAALAHFCGSATQRLSDALPARNSKIMVYDLGGGTFDISILERDNNTFRTLATDGDVILGGRDFDEQIVRYLAEQFLKEYGIDPRSDREAARQMWRTAQLAKHALSTEQKTVAVCRCADMRLGVELTREKFESLISHFIQRTLTTCEEVLKQAQLHWTDLDELILVGGSSRIPAVTRSLAELSGKQPQLVSIPDEIVAHGAAIYAATQSSSFLPQLEIINVNSHSLGVAGVDVQTQQPVNKIIIPRNTPLPASAKQKFVTRYENQEAVGVNLLEGESENPRYCTRIARCKVELDPGLPERTEVVVTVRYGTDGTISASAVIPRTRQSAHVELARDGASHLDSLEVWASRLIRGQEQAGVVRAQTLEPPTITNVQGSTLKSIVQRSDYLLADLGGKFLATTVPVNALPSQRAARDAQQEVELVRRLIGTIELKLNSLTHRQERIAAQVDLATLRTYLDHATQYFNHLKLSVGRECSLVDYSSEQHSEVFEEIRQLRTAVVEKH